MTDSQFKLKVFVMAVLHHLTHDTIYKVQNDFVALKARKHEAENSLNGVQSLVFQLQRGARSSYAQETFIEELRAFLEENKTCCALWNPR